MKRKRPSTAEFEASTSTKKPLIPKELVSSEMDEKAGKAASLSPDSTDKKKQTHLRCERQRREAINSGYQELKDLLPSRLSILGCKTTNASVLFRACEYMRQLEAERDANNEKAASLRSQLAALEMINQQYEQLSAAKPEESASVSSWNGPAGPAQIKFDMFCRLMDEWFTTFDAQVDISNYSALTRTLLTWLEKGINFADVPSVLTRGLTQE